MGEDAVDMRVDVDPPLDSVGAPPAGVDAVTGAGGAGAWGPDNDALAESAEPGMFSEEIEDIDASDWDVDVSGIWGDDGDGASLDDGGVLGGDFPL